MSDKRTFQQLQYEFAAHIRDPDHVDAPEGIENRRLAIYRELFYNNVQSLLAGTFPILRKVLPDPQWHRLLRRYFSRHQSHTPLFLEIPQEFISYLQEEHELAEDEPAFMLELAHYEWAELAVSILEDDPDLQNVDPRGDPIDGVPVISPTCWSLAYTYPVHMIKPDFQPTEPNDEATFLVVYRNQNDEVGFLEINAVTARLIELIERDEGRTGREILEQIAEEIGHTDASVVVNAGRDILERLHRHDVVLGTAKS
ncbi:MAG: putative DNA-binding domain-containing protein [Gammaproteobacteria bacterium]|nr:putative DNA-binding domain-containing protein [Gammaproteobacteria bacterium]MDH3769335.1 putative DNA-binding domain-containing protein [Gammaproteobacteria bacterium]